MGTGSVTIEIDSPSVVDSYDGGSVDTNSSDSITVFETPNCCVVEPQQKAYNSKLQIADAIKTDHTDGGGSGRRSRNRMATENGDNYATNKNVAEGMMDIALLSANANQLRFLITYNSKASTYYISLGLIVLSLVMQVAVGIALIFKHRMKRCNGKRFMRTNEFLVGGVFMVTVVNILLAAFTTTDSNK